jgi:hypothetical protein
MPRKTNGVGVKVEDTQICVVMVGLPARGKSYIAQKGQRQLPYALLFQISRAFLVLHILPIQCSGH